MKYRLRERIGSGGMAEVFRATAEGPEGFERTFVVKRILPRLLEAPELVRMLVDEAKLSARLIHPNIAQVFELAHQDGGYYIVMEPVDGVDLGRLLRRLQQHDGDVAPPLFVAEVGRQACFGLDFAHTLKGAAGERLGIVHRDVTPTNVMVDWNGTVKLLDFGIARALQQLHPNLTEVGVVMGKLPYVSPEQLDGQPADPRSDLYSLGVILHELLTGQRLFAGRDDRETVKLVRELAVPRPSSRNGAVKAALDGIVMKALARDPNDRFQSAGEMGGELEAIVLRKRYSTGAFARQTRELLPEANEPSQASVEPEDSLGQEGSSLVLDDMPTGRTVLPPVMSWPPTPVQPVQPVPPPVPAVSMSVPPRAAPPTGPVESAVVGGKTERRRRIAIAAPALVILLLLLAIGNRSGPDPTARPVVAIHRAPVPKPEMVAVDSPLDSTPPAAVTEPADLPAPIPVTGPARPRRSGASRSHRKSVAPAATVAAAPSPSADANVEPRDTRSSLRFRSDVGDAFVLVEARFMMDGNALPALSSLQSGADTLVYAGPIPSGRHTINARLIFQGRSRGPFTYLNGYRMNVGADEILTVPEDRGVTFTIAVERNRGMNVPMEKQLSIAVESKSHSSRGAVPR
jgi:serine/threonine protein kinase